MEENNIKVEELNEIFSQANQLIGQVQNDETNPEKKESDENIDFDLLKLYFRELYQIETPTKKNIIIKQPTIGDIVEFGEKSFYSTVYVFITNTTSNRLELWYNGIDWNEITDYDLFLRNFSKINPKVIKYLFEGLDFEAFVPLKHKDDGSIVLYNTTSDIVIDETVYNHISQYFRKMFGISPKVEKTESKVAKEMIIEEEEFNLLVSKKNSSSSMLLPLISSCVNHPGFKYKSSELKEVGIFEFMDSTKRLQVYESATAMLKGMCSGFVDGKKIKEDNYNFMKEIN